MPAQYKVASLINDSVQLNMMRIGSKPIEFILQIAENVPVTLIGDELRIKQILNNLLSNAFKYTDSGKVILAVRAERLPGPTNNHITLVLDVKDTGHGMTEEQLNKMFDEYSRFHHKSSKTIEGTGLGLAISHSLVNLMNGEIHVESEPGVGSNFVLRLQQELVDDEVLGSDVIANLQQFRMSYMTQRKRGQIVREPMPYGSVLIVDDVETNLYVASGLMKLYMLQIDTAMSGQEAIDKIKDGKVYDVVFMDHMMPEMDGIEAVKRIRAWEAEKSDEDINKHVPIVALTANAVAGQAEVFLQNGFDAFISKPIDLRQLNSVLNNLIRDKQPPEVIEAAREQKIETANDDNGTQIDPMLIESFMRDARKTVTMLEEFCEIDDFEDAENLRKFTVAVHGIKSSLWNIGETEIADFAYKLELSGREKKSILIKESTPEFIDKLRNLLDKLETSSENSENRAARDEDIEYLCKQLKEIQEKAEDYNRRGALDIITGIKNCSKETKKVLDKIMEHVIHSEFEEAQSTAAEYAAKLSS
jgi:CheY-like chemotaxis protein